MDDTRASAATAAATAERVLIVSMTQPRWALLKYADDVVLLEESRCTFSGPLREVLDYALPTPPAQATKAAAAAVAATAASPASSASSSTSRPPAAVPAPPLTKEEFTHWLYRLAAAGNGSLSRALGPNASSRANPSDPTAAPVDSCGGGAGAGSQASLRGSGHTTRSSGGKGASRSSLAAAVPNVTRVRAAIDAHLQRCASGELDLPGGWQQYRSPGGFVKLFYLFTYSILGVRNNILVDASLFLAMVALAVLLAAIYGSQGDGQVGMQNRVGIVFFLVSTTFLQSVLSAESTQREYLVFQRHRAHGYYPAWVYLTYRAVSCAVLRFAIASSFALVVFLTSNFGLPWGQYSSIFELAVIIAITSFTSYFTVLFTCTLQLPARADAVILFALYTVNIIVAGLVLNLTTLPRVIQMISFGTILRLSYESSIVTQLWDQSFGCGGSDTTTSSSSGASNDDGDGDVGSGGGALAAAAKVAMARVMLAASPSPSMRKRSYWHDGGSSIVSARSSPILTSTCYTGKEYAGFLGFDERRRWHNMGAMAGMAALFIGLSFIMMVTYRPRRKAKGNRV